MTLPVLGEGAVVPLPYFCRRPHGMLTRLEAEGEIETALQAGYVISPEPWCQP